VEVPHQPHDSFAKRLIAGALDELGTSELEHEVHDPARYVDIYFRPQDPPSQLPLLELGLLGRMAQSVCLMEPFRNPVTVKDVQACLMKGLAMQQSGDPWLWILTPTASAGIRKRFQAQPDFDELMGIYTLGCGFEARLVVIHQLPKTPETMLIRLLGRGRVQRQALEEVMVLGVDNPTRERVLRLIGNWKIMVDRKEVKDEELLMNLSPAYYQWEEETLNKGIRLGEERGIRLGEERGIQLGEQQGKLKAVPTLYALGLSVDQISQRLDLDPSLIQQAIENSGS
jgi:hypothetical protein